MARWWHRPGIPGDALSGSLKVQAAGTTLTTQVAAGNAFIMGFYYESDAPINVVHPPNNSGRPRIDLVVLRLDLDNDRVYIPTAPVVGIPAGAPAAPVPAGDYTSMGSRIWEIPLAHVRVENGAGTVTADKITDVRWMVSVQNTTGTSRTRPDIHWRYKPFGTLHYEYDTRRFVGFDGFKWSILGESGPWDTWPVKVLWDNTQDNGWTTYGRYRLCADNAVAYNIALRLNYALNETPGTPPSGFPNPRVMHVSLPFRAADYGDLHDNIATIFYERGLFPDDMRTGVAHIQSGDSRISWMALQGPNNGANGRAAGNLDVVNENTPLSKGTVLRISGVYECAYAP